MTDINKLDVAKSTLSDLAKLCNITEDELAIDYSLNLDEELSTEIKKLTLILLVVKIALVKNDIVAVKAGLIMARIYSINLRNFFNDIFTDIEKIGWTERYDWPDIPENYQLPEHYNYSIK